MTDEPQFTLGCNLEPLPHDIYRLDKVLGAAPVAIPKAYIVPRYRDWFKVDADGNVETVRGMMQVKNQQDRPSCVGQSTARAKESDENREISARDIYRQAKRLDGMGDPMSWGTTLLAAQDALLEPYGSADEKEVPEFPDRGRLAEYVSLADVTPNVEASRKANRAKSYYAVPRTVFRETMFQTGKPIVTSTSWYESDNRIGKDGMMAMPTGRLLGGHAFCLIGFGIRNLKQVMIMANSWGIEWGDNGVFYVPVDGTENRLSEGMVSVDISVDLAKLLQKYSGCDVKVKDKPDHWHINGGNKRKYPNEIVWWSHGKLFGLDVFEITQDELDAIPLGSPMSIEEAPFKTRELVRQVRQHFGAL